MIRNYTYSRLTNAHAAFVGLFALFSAFFPQTAGAQTCGIDYIVKKDDTLASIATKIYGNTPQWRILYYANQDRLEANASLVAPGLALRVPCITQVPEQNRPSALIAKDNAVTSPAGKLTLSKLTKRIDLLTAEGYAPLTGRDLPNGGLLTDLLTASMDLIKNESQGDFDYRISWVNDWAAHLNPLLTTRAFDVGFPWEIPDCEDIEEHDTEAKFRCEKFFYSEPLYEIFEVLYVRKDQPSKFETDDEVRGKKICLTIDDGLDDVDGGGRYWARDHKVTLIRPASLQECFSLLDQRTVDGVVSSEMTGIAIATTLGIADKVKALPQPMKIQTLHAIVSKTHPKARILLYYINFATAKLRESGEYDRIVEKHLSHFWAIHDAKKSPPHAPPAKEEKPNGGSPRPEQSDSLPQRGIPEPKRSQARK